MRSLPLIERLALIVAERLDVPGVPLEASMDTTPEWDSLRHLQIMYAIERNFGVTIEPEDAIRMTSLQRMTTRLMEMGVQP